MIGKVDIPSGLNMTDSLHQLLGAVRAGEGRAASTRGQGIAALVLATLTILASFLINSAYRSREQIPCCGLLK